MKEIRLHSAGFQFQLFSRGGEWRVMRSQHPNANDIHTLYVINISLWIKTSFEVMVKGCIPIIYKNLGVILSIKAEFFAIAKNLIIKFTPNFYELLVYIYPLTITSKLVLIHKLMLIT